LIIICNLKREHIIFKKKFFFQFQPGNILLSIKSPISVVKLADFGLSKKITENTHLKTFCGSLAYLAPEVFSNRKNITQSCIKYTNKVDSWSFGVILYEW